MPASHFFKIKLLDGTILSFLAEQHPAWLALHLPTGNTVTFDFNPDRHDPGNPTKWQHLVATTLPTSSPTTIATPTESAGGLLFAAADPSGTRPMDTNP